MEPAFQSPGRRCPQKGIPPEVPISEEVYASCINRKDLGLFVQLQSHGCEAFCKLFKKLLKHGFITVQDDSVITISDIIFHLVLFFDEMIQLR